MFNELNENTDWQENHENILLTKEEHQQRDILKELNKIGLLKMQQLNWKIHCRGSRADLIRQMRVSELKDRSFEMTKLEEQKEKGMRKVSRNYGTYGILSDRLIWASMAVPEREDKKGQRMNLKR